jgi:DNA-binding CsgD family transcriptional regulator
MRSTHSGELALRERAAIERLKRKIDREISQALATRERAVRAHVRSALRQLKAKRIEAAARRNSAQPKADGEV